MAANVAGTIEPKLRQSEIEHASRKPAANLTAYDLYLRALAQFHRYTDEWLAETVALLLQALAIDPSYGPAAALVGWCRMCFRGFRGGERYRMPTYRQPFVWRGRHLKPSATMPRRWRGPRSRCSTFPAKR
jgi:hypothetical protein